MDIIRWLCFALVFSTANAGPLLINAQQRTFRTEPNHIRNNFQWINSWTHFDGMTISTPNTTWIMNGTPRSQAEFAADFAPLEGLVFDRLKHNFVLVGVDRTADFFDDWSVTVHNFRLLARILKTRGFKGIAFDNEEYERHLWNYPETCRYPSRSLSQYQAQARTVGRRIMRAVVEEFPEIVLLTYIGPAVSFSKTPPDAGGGSAPSHELQGPFSIGMLEALEPGSRFIDGGEIYHLRSQGDFENSYQYRKYGFPKDGCHYLPENLRALWPERVEIAFGVYNRSATTPGMLHEILERALGRTDSYVWLYSEGLDWNTPGGVPSPWIEAAKAAIASP